MMPSIYYPFLVLAALFLLPEILRGIGRSSWWRRPSSTGYKTRLQRSEHSQQRLGEALIQAAAALNSSLDLEQVLDQILEQTLRVAGCRSANLLLLDPESEAVQLVRRKGSQNTQIQVGSLLPLSLPTLQSMYITKKPILLADTYQDPRWTVLPGTDNTRSYAGSPLLIGSQVVGFLNLDSNQANFFNQETTRRLEAFAAHAAMAIHNARLYRRMQQYAIELEDRVRERTAELQAAKEYIECILACVPDAVFVLNEQGKLRQANPAGEGLLEWAGQHRQDLFSPALMSATPGGPPSEQSIIEVEDRSYQALASDLSVEGKPSGKILVFRDVTRFRELDKMKTKFVSDVSHELRTPLTNMTIYLDLMANTSQPEKRSSYLDILKRETGRLTHLIENLLMISRLEAGRQEIFVQPVDANRLVTELASDRTAMASDRGLELACDPCPGLPPALADHRLLNQAISNLLTNAINYTLPGGRITIQPAVIFEHGEPWVTIQVKDTGVGIKPEEVERIFERFYRGSASEHTKASGTGLGLPISKEIIERMGGRVTVETMPDNGTTFTVWLRAML